MENNYKLIYNSVDNLSGENMGGTEYFKNEECGIAKFKEYVKQELHYEEGISISLIDTRNNITLCSFNTENL